MNLDRLEEQGVIFLDKSRVYIDDIVEIGEGTLIYPDVTILGNSIIGKNNTIGSFTELSHVQLGDGNEIKMSSISNSRLQDNNFIGPFCSIRDDSVVGSNCTIGNFVEIKASVLKNDVFVKHLSYIGNTTLEDRVDVGAGTVVANFDGKEKYSTNIGADVFIGSNSTLIAPLSVGENAMIGAGSVITEDVPPSKLAIARSYQSIHERKDIDGNC